MYRHLKWSSYKRHIRCDRVEQRYVVVTVGVNGDVLEIIK